MDVMKAMLDPASYAKEKEEEDDFDEDDFSVGESSEEEEDEGKVRGHGEAAGREREKSQSGGGGDERMDEVMAAMDREIGVSEVGKSFEKMKVSRGSDFHMYFIKLWLTRWAHYYWV